MKVVVILFIVLVCLVWLEFVFRRVCVMVVVDRCLFYRVIGKLVFVVRLWVKVWVVCVFGFFDLFMLSGNFRIRLLMF